ncbi:MAG TPA: hypothetical protein VNH18_18865, partial [Bryobacteraceae bacterium]|nr:hypothetical protein [Bryobacteraceae bacterium]
MEQVRTLIFGEVIRRACAASVASVATASRLSPGQQSAEPACDDFYQEGDVRRTEQITVRRRPGFRGPGHLGSLIVRLLLTAGFPPVTL